MKKLITLIVGCFIFSSLTNKLQAQTNGMYIPIPLFCSNESDKFLNVLKEAGFVVEQNWVEEDGRNIVTYWKRPLKDNYSFALTITLVEGITCLISMGNKVIFNKGIKATY